MKISIFAALLISFVLSSGCSSTQSMVGSGANKSAASMFPLSEAQADRILATAITREFTGSPISRVEFPNKGYQATIRFALDSHTIVAYMISAKGKSADGTLVNGYYFEVSNAGTMPLSGGRRAGKVYESLIHDASLVAPALPLSY